MQWIDGRSGEPAHLSGGVIQHIKATVGVSTARILPQVPQMGPIAKSGHGVANQAGMAYACITATPPAGTKVGRSRVYAAGLRKEFGELAFGFESSLGSHPQFLDPPSLICLCSSKSAWCVYVRGSFPPSCARTLVLDGLRPPRLARERNGKYRVVCAMPYAAAKEHEKPCTTDPRRRCTRMRARSSR